MAELEADLGLRIDSALNAVAQLDRALTQVADDAGDLLATDLAKGVQIDASPLGTAIEASVKGADTDVAVGDVDAAVVTATIDQSVQSADTAVVVASADAGPVTATIESAVNAADTAVEIPAPEASPITDSIEGAIADADKTVTIEVDTGDAAESLAGVAGGAESASDELASVGQQAVAAAGGLDSTASAATITSGAISVLQGNFGALSSKLGPIGGVVTGVAGALGIFVSKAITSTETTARFTDTFGALAPAILQVDIGGLNLQLSDLTAKVGASGVGLKSAASDFGQLAIASGETQKEAATTAEQLIALSAAASVLKPSLGSADQVIGGLTNSLARGGRSLAEYGITLTAGEIQARALADTGKSVAGELTQVEKATAGAALATEKYGNTLDDVVEKGSKNASVQLRALKTEAFGAISSLGAPLIAPVLDVLKSAAPAIAGIVKVIGTVLQALEPVLQGVAVGFQIIAPVISVVADVLQFLSPVLKVVAVALLALTGPLGLVVAGFTAVKAIVGLFKKDTADANEEAGKTPPILDNMGKSVAAAGESWAGLQESITPVPALVTAVAQTIVVELPGIASAFDKASKDSTVSLMSFQVALHDQLVAEQQFFANLSFIIASGGLAIAEQLAKQGPERGAAAAKAIAGTTPFQIKALEVQAEELAAFELGRGQEISTRLAEGFALGIQKQLGSIKASVNQLKTVVDQAFVIRSPSRWAMERGQLIGEGLAVGITSSLPKVSTALRQLDRFTVGSPSGGSVNVTAGAPTTSGPVSQTIIVNAAQDPEATAQAVSLRVLQGSQR